MNEESSQAYATTEAVEAPEAKPGSESTAGDEFWSGGLLIAIVIVGAVIASNIWLRRRAERDESE